MRFPNSMKSLPVVQKSGWDWVSMDDVADGVGCSIKVSSLSGRVVMSYGHQQMTAFDGSNKLLLNQKEAVEIGQPVRFEGDIPYMELSGLPVVLEQLFQVNVRWKKPLEELEVGGVQKVTAVKGIFPSEVNRAMRKIILDPGHGGHDSGGRGKGLTDKQISLDVAKRVARMLEEKGFEVVMTRQDDVFVTLPDRVALANQASADLYVSIHGNWNPSSKASGSEVYIFNFYASSKEANEVAQRENMGVSQDALDIILRDLSKRSDDGESILAAGHVLAALQGGVNFQHRHQEILRAPFFVLSHTKMPAMLIELGYLSNSKELKAMKKEETKVQMAEAIVKGILAYKDAAERGKAETTKY